MYNEKVTIQRIERFRDELEDKRFANLQPLKAEYIYEQDAPIPYGKDLESDKKEYKSANGKTYKFKGINLKEEWGKLWGSVWFRFKGKIPKDWKGKKVGVLINLEAEGCIFKDGIPWQGLTNKIHWSPASAKRLAGKKQNTAGKSRTGYQK